MLRLQAKWSRKASSPPSRMFRPAGLAVHLGGQDQARRPLRRGPERQDQRRGGDAAAPQRARRRSAHGRWRRHEARSAAARSIASGAGQGARASAFGRSARRRDQAAASRSARQPPGAGEEAPRSGKYVDAAEAARQMGVIATKMMSVTEGSLAELATAESAKFEIPQRVAALTAIGRCERSGSFKLLLRSLLSG